MGSCPVGESDPKFVGVHSQDDRLIVGRGHERNTAPEDFALPSLEGIRDKFHFFDIDLPFLQLFRVQCLEAGPSFEVALALGGFDKVTWEPVVVHGGEGIGNSPSGAGADFGGLCAKPACLAADVILQHSGRIFIRQKIR